MVYNDSSGLVMTTLDLQVVSSLGRRKGSCKVDHGLNQTSASFLDWTVGLSNPTVDDFMCQDVPKVYELL